MPTAESIKVMTIIEATMQDKTEEGQNAQLFINLSALSRLLSKLYEINEISRLNS